MTTAQADLVTIGKIERPFGVRGEFKVRLLSDVPGRLDHLKQIQVLEPTGQMVDRTVTHVRRAGSTYIMGLAGVTTPEEAGMRLARAPRPFSLHTSRHLMRLLGKSDEQWRKYLFY